MDVTAYVVCFGLAFLSGSIPFAVLIGKLKGVDIRKVGSGNPGATNLGRALGRKWGVLCFVLDVLKGSLPVAGFGVWLSGRLFVEWVDPAGGPPAELVVTEGTVWAVQWVGVAIAAVAGHMFSPWIGCRGGKGVATSLGGALGLFPFVTLPALVAFGVWYLVAKATGYVGLASIVAALTLPVFTGINGWVLGLRPAQLAVFVALTGLLSLMVIVRHRANLRRLRDGTEPKAAWTGRA